MAKKNDSLLLFKKLKTSWRKAFLKLIPLGGFSEGNDVELFHHGDQAFDAIFEAIQSAKKSIYVEIFVFTPDKVGQMVRDALIEARKRAVEVTVLYDHFGTAKFNARFLQPMYEAGIKVTAFNPIWPWRRKGPLSFRDHRKIIVIDEKIGFCGGMNISNDYGGPRYGNDRFRDSMARVKGPAAKDLLAITKESLAEAEFEKKPDRASQTLGPVKSSTSIKLFFKKLFINEEIASKTKKEKGALIQVLRSNTRRNLTHIQHSMEEIVNRAVEYCYLTTPYFLPQEGLRQALLNARLRGVDVRILSIGISDVPLMRYANHFVYGSLLKKGIRIYEMTKKTLHAKLATIDGVYASIGSYNLDHWSARRNLEVTMAMMDKTIALDLKNQFKKDLELSTEVNGEQFLKRSWFKNFLCGLVYLFYKL